MRILGIDYGTKRVGLALSDATATIASPYRVLINDETLLNELALIIKEEEIKTIVLGLPKHMNNDLSATAGEAFKLEIELIKLGVSVVMQDERRSTVEAERIMIEAGSNRKERKKQIDALAATIILQTYLDTNK